MTYLGISGLLLAFVLGATGLGFAIYNTTKADPKLDVKSPILYGKIAANTSFLTELKKNFWATDGKQKLGAIAANSRNIIVPASLYTAIANSKLAVEKATIGITADGIQKNAAGLENKVTIKVTSDASAANIIKNAKTFDLVITQTWDAEGKQVLTLTSTSGEFVKGVGKASAALFNGQIAKDADLTQWHFTRAANSGTNANGSDADYAWQLSAEGELVFVSKTAFAAQKLELETTAAVRKTTFLG